MTEGEQRVSGRWTEEQTLVFINARIHYDGLFTGKRFSTISAWNKIREDHPMLCRFTMAQMKKKWTNLIMKYKELKEGRANLGQHPFAHTWPYFTVLEEYLDFKNQNLEFFDQILDLDDFDYAASSSKSFPSTSTSAATRSQQSPKVLPNTKKPTATPSTSRAPAPTPVHLRIAPKPQPPPSPAPPVLVPLPSPIQVSQDVCLRWNSYHTNMQNSFPMLLDTEQFVDVTLACEGQFIKCHKMVLSACSTFFNELLNQNPCQHPVIILRGSKMWEIRALIDFMYRGEVNVAQDKLASLLQAAEEFQVKGLAGSSTRAPDNSPLHHIPHSPPDPTYHPGDSIDDHKPSSSKKILKRKAPQSYEPNVIHHQTSRKVPLQPIPKLKIKTREILNSTTDSDFPLKSEMTNQSHSKKIRQADSDEGDGPSPSKKSSGHKDHSAEVQIKEECMDYVDFDVASNSGSYPGTNYQQQDENGDDENYDDNNSIDPLNVDKLQCDGYDTPYD